MFDMRVELKHFNKDSFLQKQSELDRPFYAGVSHRIEFSLAVFHNSTSLVLDQQNRALEAATVTLC